METDRSPVQLLGDILDECDGLRQVDARSHLPRHLLEAARVLLADGVSVLPGGAPMTGLGDVEDLIGRTIAHAFEGGDLLRGDVVLVCNDGAYLAMTAENDGEDAYITTYGSGRPLTEYVRHETLAKAKLLTKDAAEELERKAKREELERAQRQLASAQRALKAAEEAIAKLQPAATPAPAAPAEVPA